MYTLIYTTGQDIILSEIDHVLKVKGELQLKRSEGKSKMFKIIDDEYFNNYSIKNTISLEYSPYQ